MRILRIDNSAQTETSQSRRLSNRIIDGLRALGKSPDVTVRDLDKRLPQLDRAWIEANTTPIDGRTDYQRKTLALSDTLIAEIEAANTLIIGVALYNFSIPASLKLWIDFASGYIHHILGFIGITDVTFIAADKRFKDDQALTRADVAVDALIGQL